MHLRERTVIDRQPADVWPHVAVAESFRDWSDKVTHLDAEGPFRLGQRFATHYALSGRAAQFMTEVVALEEGRLLELRHGSAVGQGVDPRMEVVERITLRARGTKTIVTKDIRVKHHGLPIWIRPLIWIVTRLGAPSGEDRLKRACEAGEKGSGAGLSRETEKSGRQTPADQ